MDSDPLFPGMVNTVGCLLPALLSLGFVVARLARSRLSMGDQIWLCVFSLTISATLARIDVTPDAISLHFPPGATLVLCYLVWRGYFIPPCLAFAVTYASMLPVDVWLAKLATGPHFNPEGIGGAGWLDGLLIFPALTALAIVYANWRMARVGRAGLFWFGQQTGGHAPEPPGPHLSIAKRRFSPSNKGIHDCPLPRLPAQRTSIMEHVDRLSCQRVWANTS